jgi:multiple sugar transport system permease protein
MRKRNRTGWRKVINGVNISGLFVVLFIVLPLYWLVITSFRNPAVQRR